MSVSNRIPTDGGSEFGHNPFEALSSTGLPPAPEPTPEAPEPSTAAKPAKHRGRVDILRVTAGRGGKTVTVVKNFVGIGLPEKERLAKAMQKACDSTIARAISAIRISQILSVRRGPEHEWSNPRFLRS